MGRTLIPAFGPMIWSAAEEAWCAPAYYSGVLDMSPVSVRSIPGKFDGDTRPCGLFAFHDDAKIPGDYRILDGHPADFKVDGDFLDMWESQLKYRPTGSTLAECVLEQMTLAADPKGLDACNPLRPETWLNITLGGFSLVDRPYAFGEDTVFHSKMLVGYQLDFAALWEDENSGRKGCPEPGTTQRALSMKCEELGIPKTQYRDLLPPDLKDEIPGVLPHKTTIGPETFDQADSSTLGPVLTWAEVLNDAQTVANAVRVVTTNARVSFRAEHDLSSANHFASADVVTFINQNLNTTGVLCRFASAAETYYDMHLDATSNTDASRRLLLVAIVTGTPNILGTTIENPGTPVTLKVSAGEGGSSSAIKGYSANTLKHSVTDTSITTGTRIGGRLRGTLSSDVIMENFFGNDSLTGGNPYYYYRQAG